MSQQKDKGLLRTGFVFFCMKKLEGNGSTAAGAPVIRSYSYLRQQRISSGIMALVIEVCEPSSRVEYRVRVRCARRPARGRTTRQGRGAGVGSGSRQDSASRATCQWFAQRGLPCLPGPPSLSPTQPSLTSLFHVSIHSIHLLTSSRRINGRIHVLADTVTQLNPSA